MSTLKVTNLSYGYGTKVVGHSVNFEISGGDVLCLLGPNGAGKTTLFKTLLGILPRLGGEIRLDEQELNSLRRREAALKMAYVPQTTSAVFPYSVHEMVLMGRTAHRGLFSAPSPLDHARTGQVLGTLGIADLALRDYTRISGGQRQLAMIARALVQEAPLIVMDEPTASLDFGNQVRILKEIRRLASRGLGVVLSTHNPDHVFESATQVLVLKDGMVKAAGDPREVLSAELLTSIYETPVKVERLANGYSVRAAQ